jgi:hypothetical protein
MPPGTYALLLTEAGYTPNAVYDDGTFSEGFTDFTAGVFQACDTDGSCIIPDGSLAVDIAPSQSDLTPIDCRQSRAGSRLSAGHRRCGAGQFETVRKRRSPPINKGETQ